MSDFINQGPVPPASKAYEPRIFESQVFSAIAAGEWVLLLGPRQHGKTSGLLRLRRKFIESGFRVTNVELEKIPPCDTYRDLLYCVTKELCKKMFKEIEMPDEAYQDDLVSWLSINSIENITPIVIIIDEAASIANDTFRNAFYGQIRQIITARADMPEDSLESRLRFIFSGTFRPDCLVQTENSPFNVCKPIYTDDLSVENASALAEKVRPDSVQFVQRIYDYVGGQPYLIQTALKETMEKSESPTGETLESVLEELQYTVSPHLQSLFKKVIASEILRTKVAQLLAKGSIPLVPSDSDCHFLQIIGLVKKDGPNLVFRNQLYKEVANKMPQLVQQPATATLSLHTIVPVELNYFCFMMNPDLQQIACSAYNGAVAAYQTSHHRLALTGFGSALEAILLDLLSRLSVTDLQTAITKAKRDRDNSNKPAFRNFGVMRPIPKLGSSLISSEFPERLAHLATD